MDQQSTSPVPSTPNVDHSTTTSQQPSRVVHIRHVTHEITQTDLIKLCLPYGRITHALLLKNNQALVMFDDINNATQFVQRLGADQKNPNRQQASIRGINVYPSFSSHKELSKGALEEKHNIMNQGSSKSHTSSNEREDVPQKQEKQNRIILVTIYNVYQFTINADTIYQVFHQYGPIEKIVMFNKSAGHQALVQYQNIQDAVRARQSLQGQSLYHNNICSLSIQFSNLTDLTVHQNSDRTRDYTKGGGYPFSQDNLQSEAQSLQNGPQETSDGSTLNQVQKSPTQLAVDTTPLIAPIKPEQTVLLVSNFNDKKMSCLSLFNIFSCYGYVLRVKIFRTKPDHALIELATHQMAATALTNLKGIEIYGKKLSINFSKHTHINAMSSSTQGEKDRQAEDFMKDFSRTNLNRFSKASIFDQSNLQGALLSQLAINGSVSKSYQRYMCQPTTTLHISNIDASVDEKELIEMFTACGELEGQRVFEHNAKRMALVKYKKLSEAVEALCALHNTVLGGKGIKVAFSTNKL